MDWINSALVGVVAGGALTFGSTVLTNRSTAQRDDRKAQAEARAKRQEEWAAFQIQSIADLQEHLDAISPVLGVDTNEREREGVLRAMSSAGAMPAHLVAYSRAMMLCSRLEDMDLAAQIRIENSDAGIAALWSGNRVRRSCGAHGPGRLHRPSRSSRYAAGRDGEGTGARLAGR